MTLSTNILLVGLSVGVLAACNTFLFTSPAEVSWEGVTVDSDQATELGFVKWGRDLTAALKESKQDGKPVLLMFQEIPGCATCQNFGNGPLSNPLLVDGIQNLFHPVVVHNNRGGEDAKWLKRFGEPSWNNPVMRFLNHEGEDLVPRRDGIYSPRAIGERMAAALNAAEGAAQGEAEETAEGATEPEWWSLVSHEMTTSNRKQATFAMSCYWEGESRLGGLAGVLETKPGWIGFREVVEVTYDPSLVSYEKLVSEAQDMRCASTVFAHDTTDLAVAERMAGKQAELRDSRIRPVGDREVKYYLKGSRLAKLPMTPAQRTKVNSKLRYGFDPLRALSPTQRALAAKLMSLSAEEFKQLEGLKAPERAADPTWFAYYGAVDELLQAPAGS